MFCYYLNSNFIVKEKRNSKDESYTMEEQVFSLSEISLMKELIKKHQSSKERTENEIIELSELDGKLTVLFSNTFNKIKMP